jgi:hypothetical protein
MSARLLSLVLVAAALAPAERAAAPGPAIGLRPIGSWKRGFFIYDTRPGRTLAGTVTVDNFGTRAAIVKLYPVDATTGQTSGTVYLTSGSPPSATGAWIRLAEKSLTLAQGKRRKLEFTVRVPGDARAGQYVGGIVAETVAAAGRPRSSGKGNVRIRIRSLSIVAVQVNLPGRLAAHLQVGAVKAGGHRGYEQLFLQLRNAGNVLLRPHGWIAVERRSGSVVMRKRLVLDTLLAATSIEYPVSMKSALGPGRYRAHVHLSAAGLGGGGTTAVDVRRSFTIGPQQLAQVFRAASPTEPPAPGPKRSPGPPIGMFVGFGVGGALLLALGYAGAGWRTRRRLHA